MTKLLVVALLTSIMGTGVASAGGQTTAVAAPLSEGRPVAEAPACSRAQMAKIVEYYWKTKPLCLTRKQVLCQRESVTDRASPCNATPGCKRYVVICRSTAE